MPFPFSQCPFALDMRARDIGAHGAANVLAVLPWRMERYTPSLTFIRYGSQSPPEGRRGSLPTWKYGTPRRSQPHRPCLGVWEHVAGEWRGG